jgi:mannobiose 2-epimerase
MLNKQEALKEVKEHILPFWQNMADLENGGFYGEADFYGQANKTAAKGGILHARLLWTFSTAYRTFGETIYKEYAARARDFLLQAFMDGTYGGLYWLTDADGKVLDTRKQFYAIAFGIYAFAEHYRAAGEGASLDTALALFDATERHGRDMAAGGYVEARSREWGEVEDNRLSGKDINTPKSMNTNLHVLEAYTNLLMACKAANAPQTGRVREALAALLAVTLEKIIDRDHFELFFYNDWQSLTSMEPQKQFISYGHDIEGSWLLYEAALALGDESIVKEVKNTAQAIANAVFVSAIDHEHGGLYSGRDGAGQVYPKKEWWPQAEAAVGFINAWELSGERRYFDAAVSIWEYIQTRFADHEHGDWHNELSLDNVPDAKMPKAGFWKCPYHNARACFELARRLERS